MSNLSITPLDLINKSVETLREYGWVKGEFYQQAPGTRITETDDGDDIGCFNSTFVYENITGMCAMGSLRVAIARLDDDLVAAYAIDGYSHIYDRAEELLHAALNIRFNRDACGGVVGFNDDHETSAEDVVELLMFTSKYLDIVDAVRVEKLTLNEAREQIGIRSDQCTRKADTIHGVPVWYSGEVVETLRTSINNQDARRAHRMGADGHVRVKVGPDVTYGQFRESFFNDINSELNVTDGEHEELHPCGASSCNIYRVICEGQYVPVIAASSHAFLHHGVPLVEVRQTGLPTEMQYNQFSDVIEHAWWEVGRLNNVHDRDVYTTNYPIRVVLDGAEEALSYEAPVASYYVDELVHFYTLDDDTDQMIFHTDIYLKKRNEDVEPTGIVSKTDAVEDEG